jgi:hypothetical protein
MNDRSLSRHAITFFALRAILTQIDEHYRLVKVCGESQAERLRIGYSVFFIKILVNRAGGQ